MAKRKMMTHEEVMIELNKGLSPAELRDFAKADFWATAEVYIKTFGYLARKRREELEMTQMELADYSGIQQKEISKIERGVGNPTLRTCQQLLSALDLELRVMPARKR